MKLIYRLRETLFFSAAIYLLFASAAFAQNRDALIGVWSLDEGYQITELLFRSDGRYQLDTKSTDPVLDYSSTERGFYDVEGQTLALTPYDYLGEPQSKRFDLVLSGNSITLTRIDFPYTDVYQFKPGSREDVLARQNVSTEIIGTWSQDIEFFGRNEYTFRPGGYYFLKTIPEVSQFEPEYVRGRYEREGSRVILKPYSGTEIEYEMDFFGTTLTLLVKDGFSSRSTLYEQVAGSEAEVRAKAAEADAFLSRDNWQVGVWEIRDAIHTVDLTIRPDGHYIAKEDTEFLSGIVRGRYLLEPRRIQFLPFVGQGLYARSNGEFGKVERTRELDYYDGELQFIDLESISQSVTLARKRSGSEPEVMEKIRQAQATRAQVGWHIGIWEVNDPAGWMEFTFRPDNRYIAKSGSDGVPSQVERGQYRVASEKLTLSPYSGLGSARGFELDLYDGDLFLIGDPNRMVVARKIPNSETGVIQKTVDPAAMKGEGGTILGLWTANLPGQSAELVFRDDGEFRLQNCFNQVISRDYGLFSVDMAARTLVYDSRFVEVQTRGLDFYGNTMTIYGGLAAPSTYTVNLGLVDSALAASRDADAAEAKIDAQWLNRIPISPRKPDAVQTPIGDIPADPNPSHIFNEPTVFSGYQLYRRLIPGFVYFNEQGTIKSVAVVNTREWHFFNTGRVLVRFKNYHAGPFYPTTLEEVSDSWGAYRIEPKPTERDILHRYADNALFLETDLGEQAEMTLEDGRRNLFWGKDYLIQWEWASEQKPVPCEPPPNGDGSLMNTGISLATDIEPDEIGATSQISLKIAGPESGAFRINGTNSAPASLIVERATNLTAHTVWEPVLTNDVPAGPFNFQVVQGTNSSSYFRVRLP